MKQNIIALIIVSVLVLSVLTLQITSAQPSGGNITRISSSSAAANNPGNVSAIAGNVSLLNIFGESSTKGWQGYFGNVTGTITLGDASGNTLYDWAVANPSGEVFFSTNSSVTWTNIQCFNFTAAGNYTSDLANAGATSLYGTNLSQIHSQYGFSSSPSDGVDDTFNSTGAGGHAAFTVGSLSFSTGECPGTKLYVNSAPGLDFDNALLYEPATTSVVFTSLIEQSSTGFDGSTYDFQSIVLENGFGNTATTTYYAFVEIQ